MKKFQTIFIVATSLLFRSTDVSSSPILDTSDHNAIIEIEIDTLPGLTLNCPFIENENDDGYISDEEYDIMNFCLENRIVDSSGISDAILGTWELIGHGEGWIPTYSQPCVTVNVTELLFEIEYKDSFIDTTTFHTWRVSEGTNNYFLEFAPPITFGHGFVNISSNFAYFNATPGDGNMYLYRKEQVTSSVNNEPDKKYSTFSFYPNPTTGLIKISSSNNHDGSINVKVYNLLGQQVLCEYFYESEGAISLDLSNLVKGSYYIIIDQDGKQVMEKILLN